MKLTFAIAALLAAQPFNQSEHVIRSKGIMLDGPGGFRFSSARDLDYSFNCGMKNIRLHASSHALVQRGFFYQEGANQGLGVRAITINGAAIDPNLLHAINAQIDHKFITRAWGMCGAQGTRIGLQYNHRSLGVLALEVGIQPDGRGHLLRHYNRGKWFPLTDTQTLEHFTAGMSMSHEQRIRYNAHCIRKIKDFTTAIEHRWIPATTVVFAPTELHTVVVNWRDEATGLVRGQVLQADMDGQPVSQQNLEQINQLVAPGSALWPYQTLCHTSADYFDIQYLHTQTDHEQATPWDKHYKNPNIRETTLEFNNARRVKAVRPPDGLMSQGQFSFRSRH